MAYYNFFPDPDGTEPYIIIWKSIGRKYYYPPLYLERGPGEHKSKWKWTEDLDRAYYFSTLKEGEDFYYESNVRPGGEVTYGRPSGQIVLRSKEEHVKALEKEMQTWDSCEICSDKYHPLELDSADLAGTIYRKCCSTCRFILSYGFTDRRTIHVYKKISQGLGIPIYDISWKHIHAWYSSPRK